MRASSSMRESEVICVACGEARWRHTDLLHFIVRKQAQSTQRAELIAVQVARSARGELAAAVGTSEGRRARPDGRTRPSADTPPSSGHASS